MVGFGAAIVLLLAGSLVATVAGHGEAAFTFVVPATRNFLFYTFPAVLLMRRPNPRLVVLVGWAGLTGIVVFLLGPGLASLLSALVRSLSNADVTVLNFYVFRRAAEHWNELFGYPLFPNPGSVKNVVAELGATLLFLVLAWRRPIDVSGDAAGPDWSGRSASPSVSTGSAGSAGSAGRLLGQSEPVLVALLVLVLVLSQSRAAWAALGIAVGLGTIRLGVGGAGRAVTRRRRPLRQLGLGLAVLVAVAAAGPLTVSRLQDEGTASYDIRPELARYYWDQFLANPLTGTDVLHSSGLPAHVIAIDWGVRAGLLGLTAAVVLHLLCLRLIWRCRALAAHQSGLAAIGVIGLAALPFVRLLTTGGGTWSPIASACLGAAIATGAERASKTN
jgi:hypothetical protein